MRLSGLLYTIEKIALIQIKDQDNQESSLSKQLDKGTLCSQSKLVFA